MSERCAIKRRYHDIIPKKRRKPCTLVSAGVPKMTCTFAGSVFTPCRVSICSKYLSSVGQTSHFSLLIRRFASHRSCMTYLRFWECSSNVRPSTMISSKYANALGSSFFPKTLSSYRYRNMTGTELKAEGHDPELEESRLRGDESRNRLLSGARSTC